MTRRTACTTSVPSCARRRLPNRCSSPRRSRPMFARCVQKTNSAITTLTTNSGERGPTRDAAGSRGQHDGGDQRCRARRSRVAKTHGDEHGERDERSAAARARGTRRRRSRPPSRPLPNSRKTGRTWPTIAATPNAIAHDDRLVRRRAITRRETAAPAARPSARRRGTPASADLRARARETRSSRRGCPSRAAAGRCLRSLPARYAAGIEPDQVGERERDDRLQLYAVTPPCGASGCAADCR